MDAAIPGSYCAGVLTIDTLRKVHEHHGAISAHCRACERHVVAGIASADRGRSGRSVDRCAARAVHDARRDLHHLARLTGLCHLRKIPRARAAAQSCREPRRINVSPGKSDLCAVATSRRKRRSSKNSCGSGDSWDFAPSFNVAPTQQVPVIRSAEVSRKHSRCAGDSSRSSPEARPRNTRPSTPPSRTSKTAPAGADRGGAASVV